MLLNLADAGPYNKFKTLCEKIKLNSSIPL